MIDHSPLAPVYDTSELQFFDLTFLCLTLMYIVYFYNQRNHKKVSFLYYVLLFYCIMEEKSFYEKKDTEASQQQRCHVPQADCPSAGRVISTDNSFWLSLAFLFLARPNPKKKSSMPKTTKIPKMKKKSKLRMKAEKQLKASGLLTMRIKRCIPAAKNLAANGASVSETEAASKCETVNVGRGSPDGCYEIISGNGNPHDEILSDHYPGSSEPGIGASEKISEAENNIKNTEEVSEAVNDIKKLEDKLENVVSTINTALTHTKVQTDTDFAPPSAPTFRATLEKILSQRSNNEDVLISLREMSETFPVSIPEVMVEGVSCKMRPNEEECLALARQLILNLDVPSLAHLIRAGAASWLCTHAAGSSSACRSCCYHLQIIQAKKLVTHGNVGRTLHSRLATTYTTEISQITGVPEPEEEIEIEGYSEADDQPGDAGEQLEGAVQPEDDRGDHHHQGAAVEEDAGEPCDQDLDHNDLATDGAAEADDQMSEQKPLDLTIKREPILRAALTNERASTPAPAGEAAHDLPPRVTIRHLGPVILGQRQTVHEAAHEMLTLVTSNINQVTIGVAANTSMAGRSGTTGTTSIPTTGTASAPTSGTARASISGTTSASTSGTARATGVDPTRVTRAPINIAAITPPRHNWYGAPINEDGSDWFLHTGDRSNTILLNPSGHPAMMRGHEEVQRINLAANRGQAALQRIYANPNTVDTYHEDLGILRRAVPFVPPLIAVDPLVNWNYSKHPAPLVLATPVACVWSNQSNNIVINAAEVKRLRKMVWINGYRINMSTPKSFLKYNMVHILQHARFLARHFHTQAFPTYPEFIRNTIHVQVRSCVSFLQLEVFRDAIKELMHHHRHLPGVFSVEQLVTGRFPLAEPYNRAVAWPHHLAPGASRIE